MKRFLYSLILISLIACNKTETSSEVVVDEQKEVVKEESTKVEEEVITVENATYSTEDKTGSLTITDLTPESFQFSLEVVTENANCTGEIGGTADAGNTNEWLYADEGTGCTLTFIRRNDVIEVREEGECDHGASCSFAGVYKK